MEQTQKRRLAVRSVEPDTLEKLMWLRAHTRLTMGSLVDDAVADLFELYHAECEEGGVEISPS